MDRKEYSKNYRDLNKEEIREYKRNWYLKNVLKVKQKSKKYYEENRDSILKKRKMYVMEKYGTDMNSKIKKNVLDKIKKGIELGYWEDGVENLLGYSIKDLIDHLNSFDYKEDWHIHHIIPVRVYNFYNQDDIRKCWSLDNIIPLQNDKMNNDIDWNIIEKNKMEHLLPDTLLLDDLLGRHHEV